MIDQEDEPTKMRAFRRQRTSYSQGGKMKLAYLQSLALALPLFWKLASCLESATIEIGRSDTAQNVGWTDGVCYIPLVETLPGDKLKFTFGGHNVYKMASEEHFDNCDFTDALLVADFGSSPFEYTITEEDSMAGTIFFSCSIGAHCLGQQKLVVKVAETGLLRLEKPTSNFILGLNPQQCSDVQKSSGDLPAGLNGQPSICNDPVPQDDGSFFVTCLSPPATLSPGGIINNLFSVHFPYPTDRRVAVIQRTWEYVEGDPGPNGEGVIPVPINQLYVHHVTGNIILAQGAEGMRRTQPEAPFPSPYAVVTGDESEYMVFHLIDLRQVDDWLPCIECRCTNGTGTYLGSGRSDVVTGDVVTGGISCCTNCTDLVGPTIDYRLRYNVTYRDIAEDSPVINVRRLAADIAPAVGLSVEYDVPHFDDLPVEQRKPGEPTVQRLERVAPFNQLFGLGGYEHEDVKILRCISHLHVAGVGLWLYDEVTGEVLCDGVPTYGTDPETNQGFVSAIQVNSYDVPHVIPVDRSVRLVSDYDASEIHTGVMGILLVSISSEEEVTADDIEVEVDVCSYETCDASLLPSLAQDEEEGCVDFLNNSSSFCQIRGICSCQELMDSDLNADCGGVVSTLVANIVVNAVCAKHCNACSEGCQDIFDDCQTIVEGPFSTGCDGTFGRQSATTVSRFCPAYCNACDEETQEQMALAELFSEYLKVCKYSTPECQHALNNLYSCGEGKPGSEGLLPSVLEYVLEHGQDLARQHAFLGSPELHVGKDFNKDVLPCNEATSVKAGVEAPLGNASSAFRVGKKFMFGFILSMFWVFQL